MITNLEWLQENDREGLIEMAASDDCDVCKAVDECDGEENMTYEMCADFRKEWFKSEHMEQEEHVEQEEFDDWEYFYHLAELDMFDYCKNILKLDDYVLYSLSPQRMHSAIAKDIIKRCEKLFGAE